MKLKRMLWALGLCLSVTLPAHADDLAKIKQEVANSLGGVKVTSVQPTPYDGLYEVVVEGHIFYTDAKVRYFMVGSLVDARSRKDLTESRQHVLNTIPFDSLPFNLALKEVRGNGKRKLAMFTDPDCPFCKRMENDMVNVTNVTIYRFIYPLETLHPHALAHAKEIWCSSDRLAAWNAHMLKGENPTNPGTCATPLQKVHALGVKYHIKGTPTLIFANGMTVPGAIPVSDLEKLLDQAQAGH